MPQGQTLSQVETMKYYVVIADLNLPTNLRADEDLSAEGQAVLDQTTADLKNAFSNHFTNQKKPKFISIFSSQDDAKKFYESNFKRTIHIKENNIPCYGIFEVEFLPDDLQETDKAYHISHNRKEEVSINNLPENQRMSVYVMNESAWKNFDRDANIKSVSVYSAREGNELLRVIYQTDTENINFPESYSDVPSDSTSQIFNSLGVNPNLHMQDAKPDTTAPKPSNQPPAQSFLSSNKGKILLAASVIGAGVGVVLTFTGVLSWIGVPLTGLALYGAGVAMGAGAGIVVAGVPVVIATVNDRRAASIPPEGKGDAGSPGVPSVIITNLSNQHDPSYDSFTTIPQPKPEPAEKGQGQEAQSSSMLENKP